MSKIAVVVYGQPGSGKGTQADLLTKRARVIHFDTGKFLETQVHDPKRQKETVIKRERKLFDEGMLMTPSFVSREVANEAKRIAKAGWSIVFSGSPRTLYEAERLVPELEQLYGKKNIFVFKLKVSYADSSNRNATRRICSFCRAGLLSQYYPINHKDAKHCPICGGSLYTRTLDDPEVIKVRIKEYEERTKPVMDFWKKRGYKITEVNGTPAPFKVFDGIWKKLKTVA